MNSEFTCTINRTDHILTIGSGNATFPRISYRFWTENGEIKPFREFLWEMCQK
jgi:hypothetical protein